MWELYVFSVLAGIFGANGVPHFIKGVSGEPHRTPFGRPSSAVVNVIWGWVNIVIALLFLYWGGVGLHPLRAFVLVALGSLAMGVFLALMWNRVEPKVPRR